MTRLAFFDTKPYDRRFFEPRVPPGVAPSWFEAHLRLETAALAEGHRVVCAFVNDDLGAPVLEALASKGVELLALRCAGYNNVDVAAAARLGITVVRVPAYSPEAVAEHAVALLLTLVRKTHRAYNRVREGNFSLIGLMGFNLAGRTAGIVGLGKIGKALARILLGFGMHVLASDKYADPEWAQKVDFVPLETLLARADVVSLHAPLDEGTHHLIDERRIALMKPGVVLINTSRGGLVSAPALISGLKSGRIGAAGLDVYEEESEYFFEDRSDRAVADDVLARLMTFPNVLITGHQGFFTEEALAHIAETTAANIGEFLSGRRGEALANVVLPT
jgi:D-lactate dehydrogenase